MSIDEQLHIIGKITAPEIDEWLSDDPTVTNDTLESWVLALNDLLHVDIESVGR